MKIKITFFLLSISLISSAQWKSKGPNYGSFYVKNVNSILWGIENSLLPNSGATGLYKSNDNGNTWQKQNIAAVQCIDLEFQNGTYLLGTNKGLYRSLNNGLTFFSTNNGLTQNDSLNSYYKFVKAANNRIIAYGYSHYYSDNDGQNWVNIPTPAISNISKCIYANNKIYAATFNGFAISNNNGLTWAFSNAGLGADTTLRDINNFNSILYCISNLKIYKSIDWGQSWTLSDASSTAYLNLFNENNKLYASKFENTFEYNTSNNSWQQSNICQSQSVEMKGYFNGCYFGVNSNTDCLLKSINNGANWTAITDTIKRMNVTKLSISNNMYAIGQNIGTAYSGGFLFDTIQSSFDRYTLYNQNYTSSSYSNYMIYDIKKRNNGTIYIGTGGGVWKSINNGVSYTQSYNGIPVSGFTQTRNVYDMFISGTAPNDTLFAATDNGIYFSTNDAQTFTLCAGTSGAKMQQFLKYDGILYCAGTKIYKRTSANNWAQFTTFANTGILGFAATDGYLFVAVANSSIKYASITGLTNFANIITNPLGTYNSNSLAAYDTLLFFRNQNGVFKVNIATLGNTQSTDIIQIADNLPYYFNPGNVKQYNYIGGSIGFGMAIFNGKLWLGTNGMSTFYRSLNDFGYSFTVGSKDNLKQEQGLVYPNPANDKITITGFTKGSHLIIYNIAGQVVINTTYANSQTIDINKLNSGIYNYSVIDSNQNITDNGKFIKE